MHLTEYIYELSFCNFILDILIILSHNFFPFSLTQLKQVSIVTTLGWLISFPPNLQCSRLNYAKSTKMEFAFQER